MILILNKRIKNDLDLSRKYKRSYFIKNNKNLSMKTIIKDVSKLYALLY